MKVLEATALKKKFYSQETGGYVRAVDEVSFFLERGEFLGLVGESGCGKSTVAKLVTGLLSPDQGRVVLAGEELGRLPFPKAVYKQLQMVFQNPQDSFDPRRTIGSSILDIQRNFGVKGAEAQEKMAGLLERVGLPGKLAHRFPWELSGGECQRAAIARAIAVSPQVIICDEITSALDVSVQAQIVELLEDLREEMGLSLLFISHDLALVQGICRRVLVMYQGRIVEEGSVKQVLTEPRDPYTQLLLSSVLTVPGDEDSVPEELVPRILRA